MPYVSDWVTLPTSDGLTIKIKPTPRAALLIEALVASVSWCQAEGTEQAAYFGGGVLEAVFVGLKQRNGLKG